jgi:hypothetical protein
MILKGAPFSPCGISTLAAVSFMVGNLPGTLLSRGEIYQFGIGTADFEGA